MTNAVGKPDVAGQPGVPDLPAFDCGVYRSESAEAVETERFALVYYCSPDKSKLGTKLYSGGEREKRLVAVCERNQAAKITEYAYCHGDGGSVISNSGRLSALIGEAYDRSNVRAMRRLEKFCVDHSGAPHPVVSEAGIPACLALWRMGDSYTAQADRMNFYLCTGRTEYVFFIVPEFANIYCGASYNIVFDGGLLSGGQFFRIRNYGDNSAKYCGFFCDFSYEPQSIATPTETPEPGKCTRTSGGLAWTVKRYTDDEIVLAGCGDDEYVYRRGERRDERFFSET